MKTITPKNAFKLFLFLLILFSAKAFSFTKFPTEASSSGCESRIGCVNKTKKVSRTPSTTYSASSKSNTTLSKNTNKAARSISLKEGLADN